jgi:hypothetical protein
MEDAELLSKMDNNNDKLDFLLMFQYNINWENILKNTQLHESIIEHFINYYDRFCWLNIVRYQRLSESFIRKYKQHMDIGWLIRCQKLSDNFIKEFSTIFKYYNMTVRELDCKY